MTSSRILPNSCPRVAEILIDVLNTINRQIARNDKWAAAHKLMILIPALLFPPLLRGGTQRSRGVTMAQCMLGRRVARFQEGRIQELAEESVAVHKAFMSTSAARSAESQARYNVPPPPQQADQIIGALADAAADPPPHPLPPLPPALTPHQRSGITNHIRNGQISRARNIATSNGIAEPSQASADKLKLKFPPAQANGIADVHQWQVRGPEADDVVVEWGTLLEAILTSPTSSAPGRSGWRPDHIKSILRSCGPHWFTQLKQLLPTYIKSILMAEMPRESADFLRTGILIGLNKDSSPDPDLRPIVLPDTWLKIAERLAVRTIPGLAEQNERFTRDGQYAAPGIKGGPEAAPIITRLIHDRMAYEADQQDGDRQDISGITVTVSVDIANAFNSISRSAVAAAVREWFPHLLPYTAWMYSTPSVVHYIAPTDTAAPLIHAISVETGVLQGSAASQLIFDAAFHQVLCAVNRIQGVTVTAIHDDLNITGNVTGCAEALAVAVTECSKIDLKLRPEKSKLSVRPQDRHHHIAITHAFSERGFPLRWPDQEAPAPEADAAAAPAVQGPIQVTEGITIAGTPVGSQAYVVNQLDIVKERVSKLSDIIKQLAHSDAQSAMLLTRYCLNSMGNHLLRTLPPRMTTDFALEIDKIVYNTSCHIINSDPALLPPFTAQFTPTADTPGCGFQFQLDRRTSSGGFGIGRASKIRSIAHAGSWYLVANMVNKVQDLANFADSVHLPIDQQPTWATDILQTLDTAAAESGTQLATLPELVLRQKGGVQSKLTDAMADRSTQFDQDDKALEFGPRYRQRIQSQAGSGAMSWLSTLPYRAKTRMSTAELRAACQFALGVPLEALNGVTHCFALHRIDMYGHHFTTSACGSRPRGRARTGNWRSHRHNMIRDEIGHIANQCGISVEFERQSLPGLAPTTRCDLVLLQFPTRNQHTVIDVVIKSSFGQNGELKVPGDAPPGVRAAKGEADKFPIYADLIHPYSAFTPASIEEFGRRGPALDKLLDALAVRRTCQILNVDTTQQNPDDAHPLFDRTKRPLLDHWRRNISFVLAKENVACFMHGVNNARNGQFQCDDQAQAEATESVHHVDLNYETSRMNV